MYLEIVTPEASLVSGEVESVTVPGMDGEFQMLNNHAAIVSLLVAGEVRFKGNPTIAEAHAKNFIQKDGKWTMQIKGGTVECSDNKVIVLAD
ncbi:F0F1 ATP synthase subunit epsilon [Rasiella sp. SM2506]|uniref:F0F1 ATP synthase subunit epsilon n=1 Tax=Rasiella sp. SM2506 TaxID=3423914 RepID=UPI003D7B2F73